MVSDITAAIFDNQLRYYLGADPFKPFLIRLNDQRVIAVEDRWKVAYRDGVAVVGGAAPLPDIINFADVRDFAEISGTGQLRTLPLHS